jgi:hypothetical protein
MQMSIFKNTQYSNLDRFPQPAPPETSHRKPLKFKGLRSHFRRGDAVREPGRAEIEFGTLALS